ncbi:MAG: HNH endonuclease [Elusimicrobia bacterium]|nr:HNH endonuclease [Elusimicrobiota bacterium]
MHELKTIGAEILATMTDEQVLSLMDQLAAQERGAVIDVLICLAEVDRRALPGLRSCSDLFDYCVRQLRMSRGSAYRRIHAARAAARHPELYAYVRDGELSLCVLSLIVRELGLDAIDAMRACRGKSTRETEIWLAARKPPSPALPDKVVVRAPILPSPPPEVALAADERAEGGESAGAGTQEAPAPAFNYSFTASAELHSAIERLKDILWLRVPFGALDGFLKIAVFEYVERHDPAKRPPDAPSRSAYPAAGSKRRVSASVRNVVWARDGGRCAFVSGGRRCASRRALELDHVIPFSAGGRSDDPANIRLLCREHNQLARRRTVGEGRLFDGAD